MKLIYQFKVLTRLNELIKKINIDNPSGEEFTSLCDWTEINTKKGKKNISFKKFLCVPYDYCLEHYVDYLHKENNYDDWQGCVFIIVRVYADPKYDIYKDTGDQGKFGELMEQAKTSLMEEAVELMEENPDKYALVMEAVSDYHFKQ